MDPQLDQESDLLKLKPKALHHILKNFPLKELVRLRPVCKDLNKHVLQVMESLKSLEPYRLSVKKLKLLLPKLKGLSVVDQSTFDWDHFSKSEMSALAELLGQHCPNIEYIDASNASPDFILQYTRELEDRRLPVKITKVALYSRGHLSRALLTLLERHQQIEIRVIDNLSYIQDEFQAESMKPRDFGRILSRVIILRTRIYRLSLGGTSKFLRSLVKLRVLAIKILLWHVPLIAECCPSLEHLRLDIFDSGQLSALEYLKPLISSGVSRYASFGLVMKPDLPEERQIVDLLVNANAKFRHYPDEYFQTRLNLSPQWIVALSPHLEICSWPSDAVDSLFRLFPTTNTVLNYETLDNVDVFLRHLNHIRALSIRILVEQVHLIPEHCPNLRRLKIHNSQLYESMKLEKLHTFVTTQVPHYESFSLVINQTIPDDEARKIANLLVQAGAKFKCSQSLGSAELKLGPRWDFVLHTHRSHPTVNAWPKDDVDLFAALINPSKSVYISYIMPSRAAAPFSERLQALGLRILQ